MQPGNFNDMNFLIFRDMQTVEEHFRIRISTDKVLILLAHVNSDNIQPQV